ncbi:MAG: VWA domain-containing protein [Candidatus Methanoperedenaceae archaeon]|nr:VWA domain-containing protein [Candidatus Methanoperedenaceae archaeon]
MQFANQVGLYALLSIIPLIIIYLLRPRPLKIKIPSLMFLMDIEKKKRLNVFRKFLKDPLFLMQLFVLILASLAIAEPFIISNEELGGGHTVFILDASASMQADGRFERAVEEANKFLSSKNTVILAENVPLMAVKEVPAGSASDTMKKLNAKATTADISGAMLLGRRMLPEGGRMVVVSDFASWTGEDPAVSKRLAEANGITVEFVTVTGKTDNIGIVGGWFEGSDYRVAVHNFNKAPQTVKLDAATDGTNKLTTNLNIKAESNEYFTISDLGAGKTKISIDTNDALSVDNSAYVIIPVSIKKDILYVTNNTKVPSIIALDLAPFATVSKTNSGNIPALSSYPIVMVSGFLSPESVMSLSDHVKAGKNAVIIASPELVNMDMLPVELGEVAGETSINVARGSRMTEDIGIEKIKVKKHFKATPKRGAVTLVEGGDKSSMLAYWKYGKGIVIYSGIADPAGDNIFDPLNTNVWNDFHALPEYPLFWKQMLEWITGSLDVSEYNAKTGQYIRLAARETVRTPSENVTTDLLLLDEVGIYGLPDKEVAVNLYDEKESNLAGGGITALPSETKEISYNTQIIRAPKYFDIYLIMIAIILVILELYYLRWRGEL